MNKGTIAVFHSKEFPDKFSVVATTNNNQKTSAWYVVLRDNLSQGHAKSLACGLRELVDCKITGNCGYCGGIGGCYMCDS